MANVFDPAEAQVELYKLHQTNEELLAYMNPTKEHRQKIRDNCVRIAELAFAIRSFYEETRH